VKIATFAKPETVSGNGIDDRAKNKDRTIKTNEQSKSQRNIKRLQATL